MEKVLVCCDPRDDDGSTTTWVNSPVFYYYRARLAKRFAGSHRAWAYQRVRDFWMRQYIKDSIPDALIEAGKIDGCSTFRMYWNVVVPAIAPAFATLGIIVFMNVWNDFLWPLVVLQDSASHTLQVALRSLNDSYVNDYGMIMSGTLWATAPLIAIFCYSTVSLLIA